MRLSSDKKTVVVSDDKFTWTYPMTSSIRVKIIGVYRSSKLVNFAYQNAIFEALFERYRELVSELG